MQTTNPVGLTPFVQLTLRSGNSKVGAIPVSTTARSTCPPQCKLYNNGCYAEYGPVSLNWRKVSLGERGLPWAEFVVQIFLLPDKQLWRHNQAGDLPGTNGQIDTELLHQLVQANLGKRGFTYTHYPVTGAAFASNRQAVRNANAQGFVINLSAHSVAEADALYAKHGEHMPVTCVVPPTTERTFTSPMGNHVVVCPATYKDDTSCVSCKLCAVPASVRRFIIAFPVHGTGKARAITLLKELTT